MAKNHYNYNPNKANLVVGGIKMYDYAEDAKISIAYDEDFREVVTGTDGDTITVENNNRNALITLKVLHSSPLNIMLTSLAASDKEFDVLYSDRNFNGDIGAHASKAHFVKIADKSDEKTAKAREWQIRAINLKQATELLKK